MKALAPLQRKTPPFDVPPPMTNETPHWVKPQLVGQVRFTEWTDDARLRHPAYLGLRDDVDPKAVRREPGGTLVKEAAARLGPAEAQSQTQSRRHEGTKARRKGEGAPADLQLVIDQLLHIEAARKAKAALALPDGDSLEVSNLHKIFWPSEGLTKGDLMRYYVQVSPFILPVVTDRPLVMKRYPDGVRSEAFYQHRAPDKVPTGVRIEVLPDDDVPSRPVGGSLKTLLYMTQLAAISQDPWFSRVQSLHGADHVAFDLDPMPGTSFETVLDVARWLRDELARVGAVGVPKTSGSDGLHVYVPMPKATSYEAGRIWAQIVATIVAARHPQVATVERTVRKRGAKVYVDYLQNIEGKTLACAYSARASEFAGASTPLTWDEVDAGVDRRDFTLRTLPGRLAEVGDLWKALWKVKAPDLRKVERHLR